MVTLEQRKEILCLIHKVREKITDYCYKRCVVTKVGYKDLKPPYAWVQSERLQVYIYSFSFIRNNKLLVMRVKHLLEFEDKLLKFKISGDENKEIIDILDKVENFFIEGARENILIGLRHKKQHKSFLQNRAEGRSIMCCLWKSTVTQSCSQKIFAEAFNELEQLKLSMVNPQPSAPLAPVNFVGIC